MRHSHAEPPSFPRRREPRIPAALVWMSGSLALWERVRVRVPPYVTPPPTYPQPDDNCPLRHRRASPYIGCMRHSHAESPSFPRRREPRIPAALVWMSGPLALWERVRVRVPPTSRHPKRIPKPNDNCPLRHRRASPYIGCMRHSHAESPSFPRRREPRIPAALVWMSGPLALWERVRVRVPPVWTPPPTSRQPATTAHCAVAAPAPTNSPPPRSKCNGMQPNATELKVPPLLATPEAPSTLTFPQRQE